MQYKGKKLILDNFRTILKDFTVDVQDVVRSAILDDVDISEYIEKCSPYKLDQIRLAKKEGLNPSFYTVSGEMLYQIRRMSKEGVNLNPLEKQLKSNLSEEHTKYVVQWVVDGINFSKVNIALVPKRLLEVYDRGLRLGVDMSKYDKIQKMVSPRYLDACINIEQAGKDSSFLLGTLWNIDVVLYLQKNLDLPKQKWKQVETHLNAYDSIDRVSVLTTMVRNNMDISLMQVKDDTGNYTYSVDCLQLILKGYGENLDIKELMKKTSYEEMEIVYNELKLKKEIKVSGRFVKKGE